MDETSGACLIDSGRRWLDAVLSWLSADYDALGCHVFAAAQWVIYGGQRIFLREQHIKKSEVCSCWYSAAVDYICSIDRPCRLHI